MPPDLDPDDEEVGFDDAPGDFEENLAALLEVDPEAMDPTIEEPEQDA